MIFFYSADLGNNHLVISSTYELPCVIKLLQACREKNTENT